MQRAIEYDEKAKEVWYGSGQTAGFVDFVACDRRKAVLLLAAGKPHEAEKVVEEAPWTYQHLLEHSGINLATRHMLQPVIAAVKVLAEAFVQTGVPVKALEAKWLCEDVDETEAILAGYCEGVLEETRWALDERRRIAEAAAAAAAAALVAEEEATATSKALSKAAKRKQQKRKAQQKKKAAEVGEATGSAGGETSEGTTQGQGENGKQGLQEEQEHERQEREAEEKEEQREGQEHGKGEQQQAEGNNEQTVTAATSALAAMVVGTKKGEKKGEEDEEEECSVCLNAIDGDDNDNPAGPPLVCGHRYHAFCLDFWVERCTSKCIEPTCPYCRAPLLEVKNN